MPEIFLAFAFSKRLEAEHRFRQKQNPTSSLAAAKRHLFTAGSINPEEHLVPVSYARILLIEAQWQRFQHRSPEASLKEAEEQVQSTLKLNPRSATAYSELGEIELLRVEWKLSQKQPVADAIEAGLTAVDRSIQIKSDDGRAYSIRGRLLLYKAVSQPASVSNLAAESAKNFERAFTLNPLLQASDTESLTKAKSLL